MDIVLADSKILKKRYLNFIYELYKDNNEFCDMNLIFVKNFLYKKDSYAKRCEVLPILMIDNNEIKLECMYVIDSSDEVKLAFIEFRRNSRIYLEELIKYSKIILKKYNKRKVIVGINGQISYGLGILTENYNQKFEFNSNFNHSYYKKEMDEVFNVKKRAFSYCYNAKHSLELFDKNLLDNVYNNYEFRYFNMKKFKKEMLIFGKLCHESLLNTPYYSIKTPLEMYELMKQVRFIMKKEDIIFALKDGKEVGFIYTHPDYAFLFNKPKLNYVKFFLKYLFKKPENVIYNVIGVLPEHQQSGVAVGLINKSILLREKDYPNGVSSFILEDNIASTRLCKKLSTGINKEFCLYEISGD